MTLKIIHIITRLDKGGSAENVLLTCQYFSFGVVGSRRLSIGCEVVLIYGGVKSWELRGKSSESGVQRREFKVYYVKELQREVSFIKDFVAFIKIFNIIKREKPHIVHTHTSKAGILGRWATFLLRTFCCGFQNIKIIHTPHGHIFYGYYDKLITFIFVMVEKITARITDKIIALTEGEKNESLIYGIGKPNQWVVIHSGTNLPCFITPNSELRTKLNIPTDSIVIGTVARLEPVKGVKYLIEAIPFICGFLTSSSLSSLTFLIVGDGSERKKLEKLLLEQCFSIANGNKPKGLLYEQKNNIKIFEKRLKDKKIEVIFTGMREDVAELISIMDIYVQPSLNEGMGKTIVLAELLGKPVVATKVQGIPSVVIEAETGILVKSKNSIELAEGIIQLIKDETLRIRMGQNAKLFTNKIIDGYPIFSIERMVLLLEKLYIEINNFSP